MYIHGLGIIINTELTVLILEYKIRHTDISCQQFDIKVYKFILIIKHDQNAVITGSTYTWDTDLFGS